MTINFKKWPWKLNWAQRLYFAFSPTYRVLIKDARRSDTAAAWEASGRAVGKSHPGYAPGSPEDLAYLASEHERLYRPRPSEAPDASLRNDLREAFRTAQTKVTPAPTADEERFTAALRKALKE